MFVGMVSWVVQCTSPNMFDQCLFLQFPDAMLSKLRHLLLLVNVVFGVGFLACLSYYSDFVKVTPIKKIQIQHKFGELLS